MALYKFQAVTRSNGQSTQHGMQHTAIKSGQPFAQIEWLKLFTLNDLKNESNYMNMEKFINEKLIGGFWHFTCTERFDRIIKNGFILPEPDIPDTERWSTSQGPEWYPYVRSIGGFSIFHFPLAFNLEQYRIDYPFSNLDEFIPFYRKWDHAIWLEINYAKQQEYIKSGADLLDNWKNEGRGKRWMPYVEGAHIGKMPVSSISSAHFVSPSRQWDEIKL